MLEGAPAIVGTPGAEGARGITRAVLDSVINTIRLHGLPRHRMGREQAQNYLQQFVLSLLRESVHT